jgi:rSAM/selenodomain-associated transferase 2
MKVAVPESPEGSVARPWLSVIVPTLNEAPGISAFLRQPALLESDSIEVIVVDGESSDGTEYLASVHAHRVVSAPRGRARQMNTGASFARGSWLLFLHADTVLPLRADIRIQAAARVGHTWGRFDVAIDGKSPVLHLVSAMMNFRSRWTGIATGDQAIFVRRDVFNIVGGYPDQPLMEDIELSARLLSLQLQIGKPACLRDRVITSGRRWETRGVWRTILLMWCLRWRYWRGEPASSLADHYH